MKDRIKMFSSNDIEELQNKVNIFLGKLSTPVGDIKFSELVTPDNKWHGTVMIIYKLRQL